MGNYKFRFSDMLPNAWFYKLKDMNKHRNPKTLNPSNNKQYSSSSSLSTSSLPPKHHIPHLSEERKSYYFTRELIGAPEKQFPPPPPDPPRKSSRRRRSTRRSRRPPRIVSSTSISAGCSCRASVESVWTKPGPESCSEDLLSPSSSDHDSVLTEFGSDYRGRTPETFDGGLSCSSSGKCTTENDIVIDMVVGDDKPFIPAQSRMQETNSDYKLQHLPPIITNKNEPSTNKIERTSTEFSKTNKYGSLSVKVVKENIVATAAASPIRRFSANSSSPGMKLRVNSPRIASRRIQTARKSASASRPESFAVVKTSKDPRKDFTESMMEMIVENNIRASKDLEELLACYLSLNSDEYHDLIINVFKQIWFDYIHLRLK